MNKPGRRASPLGLPRWAGTALGLYLVIMTLDPVIGPWLHVLPVYLLPVLVSAAGGAGPGLAMTAAALITHTALAALAPGHAPPAALLLDGLLFLGLALVLVPPTARVQRQLQRSRREAAAAGELLRFARHAGSPADLPLLLRAVADAGSQLLRSEYGATFLWEPRAKQFRPAEQCTAADHRGLRFSDLILPAAGSPVVAQMLRERVPLAIADAAAAPEWARVVRGLNVTRVLLVPAVSWGRVLGCMLFGRGRGQPPFGERDRRLAAAIAEHVAAALEHAEEFRVLERQADEIRRLNQDLEHQNARLTTLEQLRNDLVQMIVHDMRAPLTSIIAGMQWLERDGSRNLAPPLAEVNRIGRRSAEELLGMVNDLLDVARFEEGRFELERAVDTVAARAAAALERTRYLAQERRLTMRVEIPVDLPPVWVDRDVIGRVFVNLIGNAIKFTPADGQITLAACREEAEWVSVSVTDTGEGIPPEDHERIFEKFGQVTTRQGGRTMSSGLGLAFCKLAVEAHGGRIHVQSQPGEGATFTLTLPAAPAAPGRCG